MTVDLLVASTVGSLVLKLVDLLIENLEMKRVE